MITLSIIVVSYETREMTLECLRSVFAETRETEFELLVVDNASSDGSADAIEAEFGDRVRLIRSVENLGFAGGNNLAAEEARGELFLLLNPDTVVLRRAIDRLVAFARERPQAGIWGGRTVFADGTLNPASCWRRMTLWGLLSCAAGLSSVFRSSPIFNPEAYGGWARDAIRQVDIVSGCFLLIRRSLWEELAGFDRAFFMYGEEADLCLRARRLGARPVVTPEATIIHYGGASERVPADKIVRLLRAKGLLIDRHMGWGRRRASHLLLGAWPLTRSLYARIRRGVDRRAVERSSADAWALVWRRRREWR